MKSYVANEATVERNWILIDAAGQTNGRLAVKIANILRGKTKPTYTPHVDTGDFVVVINASQIKMTGNKEEQKLYSHYTGYPSGLKQYTAAVIRDRNPERIIMQAVKGMLPKNRLSRQTLTRLKVYAGAEHPHAAQMPQAVEL